LFTPTPLRDPSGIKGGDPAMWLDEQDLSAAKDQEHASSSHTRGVLGRDRIHRGHGMWR
jgi:hypothetical protein